MTPEEKTQFLNMDKSIQEIDEKLDKVVNALLGDDFGQNTGLISEFKDLKSRVRKLEDIKNRIMWIALGAGIAAGFTINKIGDIVLKILG